MPINDISFCMYYNMFEHWIPINDISFCIYYNMFEHWIPINDISFLTKKCIYWVFTVKSTFFFLKIHAFFC